MLYFGGVFVKIAHLLVIGLLYSAFILKFILLEQKGIKVNIFFKKKYKNKTQLATVIFSWLSIMVSAISIIFDFAIVDVLALKIIGIVVSSIATVIFIKAVFDMKSSWRVGVNPNEKTKLVTNGIYSISRNPAYLAFDLLFLGVMIGYPNIANIVVFVCYFVSLDNQAKIEEQFLENSFGEEYLNYKKTTRRYI